MVAGACRLVLRWVNCEYRGQLQFLLTRLIQVIIPVPRLGLPFPGIDPLFHRRLLMLSQYFLQSCIQRLHHHIRFISHFRVFLLLQGFLIEHLLQLLLLQVLHLPSLLLVNRIESSWLSYSLWFLSTQPQYSLLNLINLFLLFLIHLHVLVYYILPRAQTLHRVHAHACPLQVQVLFLCETFSPHIFFHVSSPIIIIVVHYILETDLLPLVHGLAQHGPVVQLELFVLALSVLGRLRVEQVLEHLDLVVHWYQPVVKVSLLLLLLLLIELFTRQLRLVLLRRGITAGGRLVFSGRTLEEKVEGFVFRHLFMII